MTQHAHTYDANNDAHATFAIIDIRCTSLRVRLRFDTRDTYIIERIEQSCDNETHVAFYVDKLTLRNERTNETFTKYDDELYDVVYIDKRDANIAYSIDVDDSCITIR